MNWNEKQNKTKRRIRSLRAVERYLVVSPWLRSRIQNSAVEYTQEIESDTLVENLKETAQQRLDDKLHCDQLTRLFTAGFQLRMAQSLLLLGSPHTQLSALRAQLG